MGFQGLSYFQFAGLITAE